MCRFNTLVMQRPKGFFSAGALFCEDLSWELNSVMCLLNVDKIRHSNSVLCHLEDL